MPDAPPDPSLSSEAEIKSMLAEPSGSAATSAGIDFGPEEPSSKSAALEAASALVDALGTEQAKSSEAISQLATSEIAATIEHGVDPAEALGAAIASGLVPQDTVDELAWQAALAEQGLTDEDLAELDDPTLDDEVDARYEQVLGQAAALGQYETAQRQSAQASEAALKQSVANTQRSGAAVRALQSELGLSGPQMREHLAAIDAEFQAGLLGPRLDGDKLAANDSALFTAALRAASATIREEDQAVEAEAMKTRVFASQPDFAAGWTFNGQPAGPEPYVPGTDPGKFVDAVARRAQGKGRYDGEVRLPAERSIRDGFTSNGRPIHPDDLPLPGGGTAKSRLQKELRDGRAS